MKVTLISYTQEADVLLLFTKSTRLNMSPALLDEIRAWPPEKKTAELKYMANTIPSSWEFVDYAFMIEGVSRAFTHQLVRTRHGSYAQQSLRVVDVSEGFDYVYSDQLQQSAGAMANVTRLMIAIHGSYKDLLHYGLPAEDARGVLPTNIATNIVAKFNLRTMTELCASRTGGRTQDEYRQVMNAMADEILKVHPWAVDFLFPFKRDLFKEIEAFAAKEFASDFAKKGELLKIIDAMRKEKK